MDDIMEVALFCMLLACSVIIALNLFALESNDLLSMGAAVSIDEFGTVLAMTFAHCYVSERITVALASVRGFFYASPWYELPVRLQRPLTLPIRRAAFEFRLKSLGLIDCSLATFLSVSGNRLSRRIIYSAHTGQ